MVKVCTKCQETKVLEEFGKLKAATDGRHSWCKACLYVARSEYGRRNAEKFRVYNREYHMTHRLKNLQNMVEYRQRNLEQLRQKDAEKYARIKTKRRELGSGRILRRQSEDGRVECTKCKEFKIVDSFTPSAVHRFGVFNWCRECVRIKQAEYAASNRERIQASARRVHLKKKYGLSESAFRSMLNIQQGACLICSRKFGERNVRDSPCVDHDHVTGRVRGLLCTYCNLTLGYCRDNPAILRKMIEYLEK